MKQEQILLVATYANEARAQAAVERLIGQGFPMDMLSVLGRVHAAGDDVLGLYYSSETARLHAWARQGAVWGGLGGLLAGAAGLFLLPGIGAVFVAGPLVEALVGALGGAAAMAGAAAVTQLAAALHGMGIPRDQLDRLHGSIEQGRYLVLLRTNAGEAAEWRRLLGWSGAAEVDELALHEG